MLDDQVVRLQLHLVVGAEPEVVVLAFGGCVDPPPLVAAERTLLVVVGDDVLAELGADGFQPVAEVADEREVSQDGVLPLRQVMQHDRHEQDDHRGSDPDEHAGILYLGAGPVRDDDKGHFFVCVKRRRAWSRVSERSASQHVIRRAA